MDLEEKRKQSFGSVAGAYDRYRPGYPAATCEALVRDYNLNAASRVLEIGCGTGQFTSLLAATGCTLDALDISEAMIAAAQAKPSLRNVRFHCTSFEDFQPAAAYNIIASATAFHWVKPEARAQLTAARLAPGGILTFLYNRNDYTDSTDPVQVDIQQVYARVVPKPEGVKMLEEKSEAIFEELSAAPQFTGAQRLVFDNTITYTAADYLGLLGTYSYQNTLPPDQKAALFTGIAEVIAAHGGTLTIPYTTVMYVLRKPS